MAGEAALAVARYRGVPRSARGSILAGAGPGEEEGETREQGDLKVRSGTEANTFTEILICDNIRT